MPTYNTTSPGTDVGEQRACREWLLRRAQFRSVAAILLVGLTVAQVWENRRHADNWNQFLQSQQRATAAAVQTHDRLEAIGSELVQHLHGELPPLREAVEVMRQSVGTATETADFVYVDPQTGGRVRLWTDDESWLGTSLDAPVALPRSQEYVMVVRRFGYLLGYAGWVILAAGFAAHSSERRRLARRMLVIAFVATYLALLGPHYWRASNYFFEDDSAGWGWIMIVISGSLILRSRTRARTQPLCTQCGYNLTGNLSGICPECGTSVLRSRLTST